MYRADLRHIVRTLKLYFARGEQLDDVGMAANISKPLFGNTFPSPECTCLST